MEKANSTEVIDRIQLQAHGEAPGRLSDVYESHIGLTGSIGGTNVGASSYLCEVAANLSAVKGGSQTSLGKVETASNGSRYSDDSSEDVRD
jgi:hypothetical protein